VRLTAYAEDSRGDDIFVLGTFRHAGRISFAADTGATRSALRSARFGSSWIINLTTGRVRTPSGRDTARSIENALTAGGDDTLIGNASANTLHGEKGADHIEGRGGDDLLDGGDGFDTCLDGETVLNCEA
jgi:Ca2+-binding RTX toxin-like protein